MNYLADSIKWFVALWQACLWRAELSRAEPSGLRGLRELAAASASAASARLFAQQASGRTSERSSDYNVVVVVSLSLSLALCCWRLITHLRGQRARARRLNNGRSVGRRFLAPPSLLLLKSARQANSRDRLAGRACCPSTNRASNNKLAASERASETGSRVRSASLLGGRAASAANEAACFVSGASSTRTSPLAQDARVGVAGL